MYNLTVYTAIQYACLPCYTVYTTVLPLSELVTITIYLAFLQTNAESGCQSQNLVFSTSHVQTNEAETAHIQLYI